ncbi:hypothetical protein ZHAS_00020258 [Anopheles sinensis]|uniref:Uncharacterized protein n=1 Tax=Anopheles sinensis TaxID=74873 RepID=A0A084WPC7_ANOSI|nr:hypothetical protein ZHAS_00020258 [Anopheles sinensis]
MLFPYDNNPAPICMFYFAHPFGIASPASGAKLAQIRERATKGVHEPTSNGPTAGDSTHHPQTNAVDGTKTHKQRKSKAGSRKEPHPSKAHRKVNGFSTERVRADSKPTPEDAEKQLKKSKKHRTHHRRISNFEKFLLEMQHCHRCVPPGGTSKIRRIDREDRITPLVPWPSIIWNREFLIPTLLQALAQQHAECSSLHEWRNGNSPGGLFIVRRHNGDASVHLRHPTECVVRESESNTVCPDAFDTDTAPDSTAGYTRGPP